MLILCYHNGALGHTVSALFDCCTKEGGQNFPSFVPDKNLHHYKTKSKLYQVKHPDINVKQEQLSNVVVSSTSHSISGRLLILLMGLEKHNNAHPEFNNPIVYKQTGKTFGEQLEILSLTLKDKVTKDSEWLVDTDYQLDIMDFWHNPSEIETCLVKCGFTPVFNRVDEFCKMVANTNSKYFGVIQKCLTIVQDVINNKHYNIDLTFYETAMCHMLLLQQTGKSHIDIKLLNQQPTSTADFIEIFKD
jgi:hypothetical protein